MRVSQINLSGIWPRSLLLIALAFSAGSASSSIVYGQHTPFVSAIARFEAQIAQDVAKDSIGGITAGVVVGNNVVWKRGFDWADVANRIPADGETIYRIGSISKPFTAMLMMQLVLCNTNNLNICSGFCIMDLFVKGSQMLRRSGFSAPLEPPRQESIRLIWNRRGTP